MKKLFVLVALSLIIPNFVLAQEEYVIRMTDEGFEPREITINTGDRVTFINEDDADRWPASNFHPTHTLYPEFDSLEGVLPGDSWSFIFEKPGTWRMHDHLIPHMTGTVEVLGDPITDTNDTGVESMGIWSKLKSFFANLWSKIFGTNSASASVNNSYLKEFKSLDERDKYVWLEDISAKTNPETAWLYVKAAYDTPEGVVGSPHDMAHLVGQLLFKAYEFEGLSTCDPSFAFGCYHGLMEVAFDKDQPEKYRDSLSKAEEGCEVVGPTTSPSYWSCIHGMGHGIATFREHEMNLSIEDCNFLPENFRTYCQDGVFMEFSISAPPSFYKEENPLYPCDIVPENAKIACGRSQSKVMMIRFGLNPEDVAVICLNSGNQSIIYHCIDSLGYYIGQTTGGDKAQIISGCNKIEDKPSAAQCLAAAAGELIFQNYVGWHDSVKTICQSVEEEYRDKCETRVEQVKTTYGRE